MKVLTFGRDLPSINALLKQEGLKIVSKAPDVIVTHGGDGYLLEAERLYPGVPKLPIRHDSVCKKCVNHDTVHVVRALSKRTISESKVMKLEVELEGKVYLALNEFSLHHVVPNRAIRFTVQFNDEELINKVIGDGLVVATPFGSHAYYRSITSGTFRLGIGIAFNNSTESIDHVVLREEDVIRLKITRGPAYFLADNDQSYHTLQDGAVVEIKQSSKEAILLGLDHFRCPDCGQPGSTTVGIEAHS